jgi:hypothetical protein
VGLDQVRISNGTQLVATHRRCREPHGRVLDASHSAESKQCKRIAMGVKIAHFPAIKTLEAFDFPLQPLLDAKLVEELATGRFIAEAENSWENGYVEPSMESC